MMIESACCTYGDHMCMLCIKDQRVQMAICALWKCAIALKLLCLPCHATCVS